MLVFSAFDMAVETSFIRVDVGIGDVISVTGAVEEAAVVEGCVAVPILWVED